MKNKNKKQDYIFLYLLVKEYKVQSCKTLNK